MRRRAPEFAARSRRCRWRPCCIVRDDRRVRSPPPRRHRVGRGAIAGAVLAIAAVAVIAGCAHAPVAMKLTLGPGRELLVPADVNGRPAIFQLDTGASTTLFAPGAPQR